ncbi:hypothetical protein FRC04_006317 [Tulasnella sp. 424]|nr:hypothetical protein FRC04_006317 [Tulasnella sp. 424]KAG8980369.1 hypothetical protein FRC05_006000 [Tulasnella sp. 425]
MPTRSGGGALGGNADAYSIVWRTEIPMEREPAALAVTMNIHGDVRSLSSGWTPEEIAARRRLVQFWRVMDGATVNVHFCVIRPEEYDDNSRIVVSCIYREDAEKCYITSFDLIRLLEGIIGSVCNIDEKNRIRRNVHHIEHDTISKSKPYHEEFFDLIMSFPAPMPRRNVRDMKAFRWEFLPDALHAIMDKMALDYNPNAISEVLEPIIPEADEAMDTSMPTFSSTLHAEPERRNSSLYLGDGGGFSFRRPSATQSALSFHTDSSVASFHTCHQSPWASLADFQLGGSTTSGQPQSTNVIISAFHHHHIGGPFGAGGGNIHQSPNVSIASFHQPAHHQSPSGSVSSLQAQLANAAFGTSPNS